MPLIWALIFSIRPKCMPCRPNRTHKGRRKKLSARGSKTGKRDEIILATKVSGAPFDWLRDDGSKRNIRLNRLWKPLIKVWAFANRLCRSLSAALADRPMAVFGGGFGYKHLSDQINRIEDILGVLADIQKAGKVRHFGLSNETPWGIMKFLQHAELNKELPRIVSVQNAYNLVTGFTSWAVRRFITMRASACWPIRRWRKAI